MKTSMPGAMPIVGKAKAIHEQEKATRNTTVATLKKHATATKPVR